MLNTKCKGFGGIRLAFMYRSQIKYTKGINSFRIAVGGGIAPSS